ncbi:MAG: error-prone DNA polymerase, partial [Clostridia bacterium]|nr:error-prone DNA polymerase [Clostridia bacterium]
RAPFASLADFYQRTRVDRDLLENLVRCGAFDRLHPNRRLLLNWMPQVVASSPGQRLLPLPPPAGEEEEDFSPAEKQLMEYAVLGLEIERHYLGWWRERLAAEGYLASRQLEDLPAGQWVKVAGLPVRPHRPPTRSGRLVVFFSLEDETGLTDVTVFEDVYQRYGHLLFGPEVGPLRVAGRLVRRGRGVGVTARWLGHL